MEQRAGWLYRRSEQRDRPSFRLRKRMIFPVLLQAESQEYSFPMGCESLNTAHGRLGCRKFTALPCGGV